MAITLTQVNDAKQRYNIIGNSEKLNRAILRALQVAPYNISVLVNGENGTGKEVIPRIIHENGPRSHSPYFAVNCGSIPQGLIESALFGHVKGAFTDAISDQKGYFESANGGTIFLDELGEMPLETQAKLLRVLETGEFIKVGSDKVQKTDVRVIAATNKNLLQAIAHGKFREDLYYRLSAIEIVLPPLRERGIDDFKLLARFFARKFADDNRMRPVRLSESAIKLLSQQEWQGNVRQYKNIIERISLFEGNSERELSNHDIEQYLPSKYVAPEGNSTDMVVSGSTNPPFDTYNLFMTLINGLGDRIKNLESVVAGLADGGEHYGTAYVSGSTTSLKRDLTVSLGDNDAVIEHVNDSTGKGKQHYKEVAMDVADVKTLDETEREAIQEALTRNEGNRKRTAGELKISERTLYRKIKQFNLVKNG